MPHNPSEKSEMSELTWASTTLQNNVAPVGTAQYVETRIRNAAKAIGWSFSRTRDIWYQDERVAVRPRELRQLEEYTGLRYGQAELRSVEQLIANADALLDGHTDPDFVGAFVAGLRAFTSALDRTRTPGGDK